jgi:Protein of unknown function (DUF1592)/Protein of unknown function (DUF1588)/Protein of unknown function (DUF1587)/Protein of unknown function (DUF1585)/Protein of unknown function (DUF1595)/Planctomycete cytochrome C
VTQLESFCPDAYDTERRNFFRPVEATLNLIIPFLNQLTKTFLLIGVISGGVALAQTETPEPFKRMSGLLSSHCVDCHSGAEPDGGLSLAEIDSEQVIAENRSVWEKIQARVLNGQMPPKDATPLAIEDRKFIAEYIPQVFRAAAAAKGPQPGPFRLRRLNRSQYNNTIRDLLAVHYEAGYALPADGAGGEGFDNAAETLFLSPVHLEKYMEAAKDALQYAAKNESSRHILLVNPSGEITEEQAAKRSLRKFANRAYRGPARDEEVDQLVQLYNHARHERGMPMDDSIWYAMQACLISPHFLFLTESSATRPTIEPLNDHELATRLSYFLWDSMPDGELRKLADDGKLHEPEILEGQIRRMLDDDRLTTMLDSFMGQWLGTRDLGRSHKMDAKIFPEMNDELAEAFRTEPIRLMQLILKENRSLLDLIDSNYVFVNDYTIELYQIPRKGIDLNQNLKRVDLPEGHLRGGLITMGGVLATSSYATRTSPVLRGKWVLEKLLNSPPPPPPPNVPSLDDKPEVSQGKTLRQRLEIHRSDAACAACHDLLDPLGFGLESFDAIGRYRENDNGQPVDASGQLPTGEVFNGPKELKKILMERKDQVIRSIVTRMMAFALGRSLVDSDHGEIDRILESVRNDEYRSQKMIVEIVRSVPFRCRGWKED